MGTAQKRPPGRPSKLTDERADRLVALMADGSSITAAATAIGVSRRTLQNWRARALSRSPADQVFVTLERRLRATRPPCHLPARSAPEDWRDAAARLEADFPSRWSLPDVGDVLDDFEAPGLD